MSNAIVSEGVFFGRVQPASVMYLYGEGAELPASVAPAPTPTPEATEGQ